MFRSTLVLAAVAAVSAAPIERVITVPVRYVSSVSSAANLVQKGRARLDHINGVDRVVARASSGDITNEDVSYVADVNIGGNTWSLIVDTGSSNTWAGAQSSAEPTSSGEDTGNSVYVSYGSGSFSGEEYIDSVSFGGLTAQSQSVGAASSATGFNTVDGIIGFGPVDLTQNTVSNTDTVPTFMDTLYNEGAIDTEVLGVSFRPESGSDTDDTNGELTLGGVDGSKYSGSIEYFPKLTDGAAAPYWGISVSEFSYNGENLGSSDAAIVDTGTTLIYIETGAYNNFLSAAGGETDSASGLSSFNSRPSGNFGLSFGGSTFTLTPDQYLIPEDQYSQFGVASGKYYSWINNGGDSGTNTIIGQKFLENYYSVFDTTNSRIGFAQAA